MVRCRKHALRQDDEEDHEDKDDADLLEGLETVAPRLGYP